MLSRVAFDLGEANNPMIRVHAEYSFDVRDKIARRFIEYLGHTSTWCRILVNGGNEYHIFPVPPSELREEAARMIEQADIAEKHFQVSHNS